MTAARACAAGVVCRSWFMEPEDDDNDNVDAAGAVDWRGGAGRDVRAGVRSGSGRHCRGAGGGSGSGQAAPASASAEKTVWYFYTVKWGKQDEFLDLFQKNHWPVLKAQLGSRLTAVKTYVPTYHGDGRSDWTFAVSITFKDVATQTGPSPEQDIVKKLFKDQNAFRAEERTRFELLEAHWDVPLNEVNFEARQPAGR